MALSEDAQAGLSGLTTVLADALDDPNLEVYLWRGDGLGYLKSRRNPPPQSKRLIEIDDAGTPVAALSSTSTALP